MNEAEIDWDSRWSNEETLLLLQTRFSMIDQFSRPDIKKKKLWEEVANRMNKVNVCQVDASICDSKYRNLMNTYRKMKDRKKQGVTDVNWTYFNVIDEYLGDQSTYILPTSTLADSFTVEEAVQDNGFSAKSFHIRKRRINESIKDIFEKKIKLDVTKDQTDQERKDYKWEERKDLEGKKILVLSSISNSVLKLSLKLQKERIGDILDKKIQSDNDKYEQRQINIGLRWEERKHLEERKIEILSSITDSIAMLAEKIA